MNTTKKIERVEILGTSGAFVVLGLGLDVMPKEHKSGTILASGPLVAQDKNTLAYRPVLWMNDRGEFVIHDQCFPNADQGNYDGSFFIKGDYPGGDLGMAIRAFSNRAIQQADHCQNLEQPKSAKTSKTSVSNPKRTFTTEMSMEQGGKFVSELVQCSQWFKFEPLPDGRCEVTLKDDEPVKFHLQRFLTD